MDGWDYIDNILDFIRRIFDAWAWLCDPARHLLLSAIAGSLAFFLMLIILSAVGFFWERLTRRKVSSAAAYIMLLSCLLVGAALGLRIHYWLDFLWLAYITPLNPPLELKIPW